MKSVFRKMAVITGLILIAGIYAGCSMGNNDDSTKDRGVPSVDIPENPICDHTSTEETVITRPTFNTKGKRIIVCKNCFKDIGDGEDIEPLGLCETPIDAETYRPADSSSKSIYFGVYPRTVLEEGSSVTIDETNSTTKASEQKLYRCNYFKGSDGYWYAKVKEDAYLTNNHATSIYKYSDGSDMKNASANSYRYFRVEPIKWERYTTLDSKHPYSYIASDILTANVPYFDRKDSDTNRDIPVAGEGITYNNNYKHSQIRAYLNNLSYYCIENGHDTVINKDYSYIGRTEYYEADGFLGRAFTDAAVDRLKTRTIKNDAVSTKDSSIRGNSYNNDYSCENTTDKIFLLSMYEASNTDMDIDQAFRLRIPTDYARANHAQFGEFENAPYGMWLLRSPCKDSSFNVYTVNINGLTGVDNDLYHTYVSDKSAGIVPCITLDLHAPNAHTYKIIGEPINPTYFTKGEKHIKCTECGFEKTEIIPELYSAPVDADSNSAATSSSKYVYFGLFPKTVLPTENESIITSETVTLGANTYYKGTDGNWYAKVEENSYSNDYKYSDNSTVRNNQSVNYRYFKVEPIKWKLVSSTYGKAPNGKYASLLVATDVLVGNVPYYIDTTNRTIAGNDVYPNNYMYSTIRAYLNGQYEANDTQIDTYENKGFLQTAFTSTAQSLIATATVLNDGASTSDSTGTLKKSDGSVNGYSDYTCSNTIDKVFLLSEKEVTTTAFGFTKYDAMDKARILKPTDYAKATHAYQENTGTLKSCPYWLRSPIYKTSDTARNVSYAGCAKDDDYDRVDNVCCGVVPALAIFF